MIGIPLDPSISKDPISYVAYMKADPETDERDWDKDRVLIAVSPNALDRLDSAAATTLRALKEMKIEVDDLPPVKEGKVQVWSEYLLLEAHLMNTITNYQEDTAPEE